ncbi:Ldh family oxidoreductase [Pseudomonas sp. ZM23]|uniref:Ldh family oxidoreductase n=1 Tax=Pseudomonas triclosanedens TaxID=2961893 RepID=A0ABY6ZZT0_9PSED|nr:Ldh family oxidoreductase [Pseudomonas triclosanedens]MCP8464028.1 Ldh family oxidoreductase [Pseudomonas triclosanedens]MCP8469112.1 Ldh family oxidoreductase [Pseudomonas triclosanedens]MCP8475834.1 Ldh family oxidoreductase [Pseudomonas triclosanedens]WAI50462.1 Ldh family oxidoreductase [Pseudomonas triclosanedens]
MTRLSLDELRELSVAILRHNGFSEPHVQAVTDTVLAGERDGCTSHGVWRLLGCIHTVRAGKVVPDAVPELSEPAPALVRVDARGGFSQCAFDLGLPKLVEKARSQGLAALAINHCVHFSALWVEIERITAHGLVALAVTPAQAYVAPAGGTRPLFGTNPIAFGWPRGAGDPYVFDFATTVVARGEIQLHEREGKEIPLGWGIDAQGNPSTDPGAVLDGAMLTFGGHKGSALATMVELIAGPLIGDLTSAEASVFDEGTKSSPYHGELLIAFDPARFLGADAPRHLARAETLFESIVGMGARLPSQRRFAARRRSLAEGVEISDSLYADLRALLE